ncbi:MAG: hypothetical protein K6B46_04580 [Opitutales bacterium]|nr:hypothetical protein [Opitutales bacterium]
MARAKKANEVEIPSEIPEGYGFIVFYGNDDFLLNRAASERWERESAEAFDEMSKEIVEGTALRVDDIAGITARFADAAGTMPMFGGKKYVWLRNVNWFSDGQLGSSEKAAAGVANLLRSAQTADPEGVCIIVSILSPNEKRTTTKKFFNLARELCPVGGNENAEQLGAALEEEAKRLGVTIMPDAAKLLATKVNNSTRMSYVELEKLACYVGAGGEIDDKIVLEMVPVFGEGDFFEPVEIFFGGNLQETLASLKRYFFNNDSARPLLTSMQRRVSLLIQLQSLAATKKISISERYGVNKAGFERAAEIFLPMYGGNDEKSPYNVFSQNPWYLGSKVAARTFAIPGMNLKRLIDWQLALMRAFESLIARPKEDEAVMCELVTECLG